MKRQIKWLPLCVFVAAAAGAQPTKDGFVEYKSQGYAQTFGVVSFPNDCFASLPFFGPPPYSHQEMRSANGVSFTITTTRFQSGNQVCLMTDLTDLMAKIPAMVAAKPMPTNNCATYAHGNPVVVIYNSALSMPIYSEQMVFTMNGKMTAWACVPGPRIPRSEWVRKKGKLPYLRVWTEAGPDIKSVVHVKPFNTSIAFELHSSEPNGVRAAKTDEDFPDFVTLVPAIDMQRLVGDALNAALPKLNHPQVPLHQVKGQRYSVNKSQVWGTS
jgi:hypothetical protein